MSRFSTRGNRNACSAGADARAADAYRSPGDRPHAFAARRRRTVLRDVSDRARDETVANANSVSPRGAVVLGCSWLPGGIVPILGGLRSIPLQPTEGTPGWIAPFSVG